MSVRSYQALLDHFRDMLASSSAVRKFLAVPNGMTPSRQAIFRLAANVEAVPVESLTTGAAGACSFQIRGDHSRIFIAGTKNRFGDSETRTELTTTSGASYDSGANTTTVSVQEAIDSGDWEGVTVRGQSCPRILVCSDEISIRKRSQTTGDFDFDGGTLCFAMEWEPGPTYFDPSLHIDDPQGAGEEFGDHLDDILCDLQKMAGTGDGGSGKTWTDFEQFKKTFGPVEVKRPQDNEGRPLWAAEVECTFGVE